MDLEAARESDLAVARDLGYTQATEDLTTAGRRIAEMEAEVKRLKIALAHTLETLEDASQKVADMLDDANDERMFTTCKGCGNYITELASHWTCFEGLDAEIRAQDPLSEGGELNTFDDALCICNQALVQHCPVHAGCLCGEINARHCPVHQEDRE